MYELRFTCLVVLYFLLGIETSIYEYSLRRDLASYGVTIASIGIRTFFIFFTWQVKFIPAIISDLYGFRGYHRQPYMIICNLGAVIVCGCLAGLVLDEKIYVLALFLYNSFICVADVNYDGCLVEDSKEDVPASRPTIRKCTKVCYDKGPDLMSCIWFGRAFGAAIGDFSGPILWETIGSHGVYWILFSSTLLSLVVSLVFPDFKRHHNLLSVRNGETPDFEVGSMTTVVGVNVPEPTVVTPNLFYIAGLIRATLSNDILKRLLIFNLLLNVVPSTGIAMFYYLTDEIGLVPLQMSLIGLISGGGRLMGVLFYAHMRGANLRTIYVLVQTAVVMMTIIPMLLTFRIYTDTDETVTLGDALGVNKFWCALMDDTIAQVLDGIRTMPIMGVAALVCERAVEAGAYASILSSLNAFSSLRRVVDSLFIDVLSINHGQFENLWILVIICFLSQVGMLIASCRYIPEVSIEDIVEQKRNEYKASKITEEFKIPETDEKDSTVSEERL